MTPEAAPAAPESDAPSGRKPLRAVATVLVTAGLLAWALVSVDRAEVGALLAQISWPWFLAAAALVPLQMALSAYRWHRVSLRMGLPLPFKVALPELYFATLLNQLLPSGVAGDGVRVFRHGRQTDAMRQALHAAMTERFSGHLLLCGLCCGLAASLYALAPAGLVPAVALITLGAVVALVAPAKLPAIGPFAADARAALFRRESLGIWAASAALLASFVVGLVLCLQALGLPMSWRVVQGLPLLLLAMSVPISLGGWGLREVTATLLLPSLGLPEEAALAVSITYGLSVLGGAMPGLLAPLFRLQDPP